MGDLQETLRLHSLYLQGEPNGKCSNLRRADLRRADLSRADLFGADLFGVMGNMGEVKTLHMELFPVAWIKPPDSETVVQIGCQREQLSYWKTATKEVISRYGPWDTWQRLWPHVLALIEASPAVPYAIAAEAGEVE